MPWLWHAHICRFPWMLEVIAPKKPQNIMCSIGLPLRPIKPPQFSLTMLWLTMYLNCTNRRLLLLFLRAKPVKRTNTSNAIPQIFLSSKSIGLDSQENISLKLCCKLQDTNTAMQLSECYLEDLRWEGKRKGIR